MYTKIVHYVSVFDRCSVEPKGSANVNVQGFCRIES